MGASHSTTVHVPLSTLLGADHVDWTLVCQSLRDQPEQACLYCHSVEPSPLHIALTLSPPTHVVALFIDSYEDSLLHSDGRGNTVAHTCVEHMTADSSSQVLQLLLKHAQANLASSCNHEGKLPLHVNLRNVQAAELLIHSHPSGVTQRDNRGRTPLHCALSTDDEIHVPLVRVLMVDALKGIVRMRDKRGITPIHLLCKKLDSCLEENGSNMDDLWQLFLDMIRNDSSPELHTICELGLTCPLSVVRYAVEQLPSQASQRDSKGRTPLHIATTDCQGEVISLLADVYPPAARMTDKEGRLAIDLAAEYGKDSYVVNTLIKAEPRAVDTRDLRDKHYPFLAAALSEHSTVSTTYELLRAKPHVISFFNLN